MRNITSTSMVAVISYVCMIIFVAIKRKLLKRLYY